MMNAEEFAVDEFKDKAVYAALAKIEKNPEFKEILEKLIQQEQAHFEFWKKLVIPKKYRVPYWRIFVCKILRRLLGLTFLLKLLERAEKEAINNYQNFLKKNNFSNRAQVEKIILDEKFHEQAIISSIKEEKVEFMGNIVLGLNDGLIELSAALVGFAFAFQKPLTVAMAGIITGVAASLSMSSSAFMHESYEQTRRSNPKKAALYTGSAYLIVVILLIFPYLLFKDIFWALVFMAGIVLLVVASMSYYSSVLLEKKFRRQFTQMLMLSVGVAIVAFFIGSLAPHLLAFN